MDVVGLKKEHMDLREDRGGKNRKGSGGVFMNNIFIQYKLNECMKTSTNK